MPSQVEIGTWTGIEGLGAADTSSLHKWVEMGAEDPLPKCEGWQDDRT